MRTYKQTITISKARAKAINHILTVKKGNIL